MSPPRRIHRNVKPIEALKAAAIILSLLIGCILVLWIASRLMHSQEPQPDFTPQPAKSMWEESSPSQTR